MKNPILRFMIAALAIYSVLFLMACPKKDVIRQAAKASYRLPGSTNDLIAKIKEGVRLKIFTPAEARRAGEILEPLADAEIVFVRIVRTAERIYRETGTLPEANRQEIANKFDELVDLFLDVLEFAGILDPDDRLFIETAVVAVRVFLRTVGIGLGSPASVKKLDDAPGPKTSGTPKPRKGKKGLGFPGISTTTAALFGSTPRIRVNPQVRFA